MIRNILAAAVLVMLVLQVHAARAEKVIAICFEYWPPFAEVRDGEASGLHISLMREAFARVGYGVAFFNLPYQRCRHEMKAGHYDAILADSESVGELHTQVSVLSWNVGVIVHNDWPGEQLDSIDALDSLSAGLVDTYPYPDVIERASSGWDIQYAPDALFNLRKLALKRIDFAIVDVPWAVMAIDRDDLPLKPLWPILYSEPQYTVFVPGYEDLVVQLDQAFTQMIEDKTVERAYQSVFGANLPAGMSFN